MDVARFGPVPGCRGAIMVRAGMLDTCSRSRPFVGAALFWVLTLGVSVAFAETGTVSSCPTPPNTSSVGFAGAGQPYGQPLEVNVRVNGIDAQSLQSQT